MSKSEKKGGRRKLKFAKYRREFFPVAQTAHGITAFIDYLPMRNTTEKIRCAKGGLRFIQGILNIWDFAPKKKKR